MDAVPLSPFIVVKQLAQGLMSKILRDCEMTRDELLKFLHE